MEKLMVLLIACWTSMFHIPTIAGLRAGSTTERAQGAVLEHEIVPVVGMEPKMGVLGSQFAAIVEAGTFTVPFCMFPGPGIDVVGVRNRVAPVGVAHTVC